MFSSNLTKFFAVPALIFTFFSGCGLWQSKNDSNSSPTSPAVADELKSEIPFTTREPERFEAEIVVRTGGAERRTFIARSGAQRRWDFNYGAPHQITNLQTDKSYLLFPARKIYAENAPTAAAPAPDDWTNFLTTEWLSAKTAASFEKLENDGNLAKYRVRLDESSGSEIVLYLDENSGLPVRQEFFSVSGEQRTLTYSFELQNLKFEPGADLFIVPADFKKVSAEEFGQILNGEK